MTYEKKSGIHIIESRASDLRIEMCDSAKRSAAASNYTNAGFFGVYAEGSDVFTLPAGHLVCDFTAKSKHARYYCNEWGRLEEDKFIFDAGKWAHNNPFHGKEVSTLLVSNGNARIEEIRNMPDNVNYAIAGIPVVRDGCCVKFANVKKQAWDASPLYATWHIFAGLKKDPSVVYVMGMKTKTGNMITSGEAYRKFRDMGFVDVIKLDGGGSFHMNVGGKIVQSTYGNRRVNTIFTFAGNPYPVPTRTLVKGRRGNDVKWLQWELNNRGFNCDVDGSFGPATRSALIAFQTYAGLEPDGSCGPLTRKALS